MTEPIEELTDDALAGPFRVWQRRRGHRYSLDDVATAWVAAQLQPDARFVLDLGCGLGSVLLMLAYKLPSARLWGIEAQAESFALLTRNCARNQVGERVQIQLGDLRDAATLDRVRAEIAALGGDGCQLVTGTPPYQPAGEGTVSPDAQRAHARVELRGGVEAYIEAAARVLAPSGRLVVCADARRPERVLKAAERAHLAVVQCLSVVPAPRKAALFSVFTLGWQDAVSRSRAGSNTATTDSGAMTHAPDFIARDEQGARTPQALALRRFFDLPLPENEPPSPLLRARAQSAQER